MLKRLFLGLNYSLISLELGDINNTNYFTSFQLRFCGKKRDVENLDSVCDICSRVRAAA